MIVYGKIHSINLESRMFQMLHNRKLVTLYLTRGLAKKFDHYLQNGLYVHLKTQDASKIINGVKVYEVVSFIKMIHVTKNKRRVFFDLSQIRVGVKKLLNREVNKMFLDLEFSMPPYYAKSKTKFIPEIIQYGIILTDIDNNIVDSSANFIKPLDKRGLNKRTFEFLNIDRSDMSNAITFNEFYLLLKEYINLYNPTIFVWGKNDFLIMSDAYKLHNLEPITKRNNFINLMQVFKNYYGIKTDVGLFKAMDLLTTNSSLQNHDALDDALMTMQVFNEFKRQIE